MIKKKSIGRLSILFTLIAGVSCPAWCLPDSACFRDGNTLVYNEVREDQDMDMDGKLVRIYSPYLNEPVYVKRLTRQIAERIPMQEEEKEFNRSLEVGMKWGQDAWRTDNMYCYYVEKKEDITVPAGIFKDCFKIVYMTCPDDSAWWYHPGLGVVKYKYRHHGTITNVTRELEKIVN
ncbi:MAG: hypothetical protein KKD11_02110 [Candidatus Omnitrophica bacterium]|nr:hypothetical protein [Candidatus Omnitrophota bacterium]